jgi:hypothetical protein
MSVPPSAELEDRLSRALRSGFQALRLEKGLA